MSNDRPQSPPPATSTETTTTTSTTDNTSAPITNTTPARMTDITPTHTTTENIQKEEATAQTSLPDVKKHGNAVTLADNDDEARFYEPMPEDPSVQKPLLRSLYVSMTKNFNIPSPT